METFVGCVDLKQWKHFQDKLVDFSITSVSEPILKSALARDCGGYLTKGIITLCEAIGAIEKKNYSWAVVRLYYSIFYLSRASLGVKGYALIRNKNWLVMKVRENERPILKRGDKFKNDHDAVINAYIEIYGAADYFQSNTVENINPYKWLAERRNQVNYHQVTFTDPHPPNFMVEWVVQAAKTSVKEVILSYKKEDGIKLFQPEHAWVAIPLLRSHDVLKEFIDEKHEVIVEEEQLDLLFRSLGGETYLTKEFLSRVIVQSN